MSGIGDKIECANPSKVLRRSCEHPRNTRQSMASDIRISITHFHELLCDNLLLDCASFVKLPGDNFHDPNPTDPATTRSNQPPLRA